MELPKEKRPPENILWGDNPDKLEEWLDKVFKPVSTDELKEDKAYVTLDEIEG